MGASRPRWWARPLTVDRFEIHREDRRIGELSLRVPGRHHGLNALAALAAAEAVGIPPGDRPGSAEPVSGHGAAV